MTTILALSTHLTSTKIGIFKINDKQLEIIAQTMIPYEFDRQLNVQEALSQRFQDIKKYLAEKSIYRIHSILTPGAFVRSKKGGSYLISSECFEALRQGLYGQHINNLAAMLAYQLAKLYTAKAIMVEPLLQNNFSQEVGWTGFESITRSPVLPHYILKYLVKHYANQTQEKAEDQNYVTGWLDEEVAIAAIACNRCVDGVSNYQNELTGRFNTGTIPLNEVIQMAYRGDYPTAEAFKMILQQGTGLRSFITNEHKIWTQTSALLPQQEQILSCYAYSIQKAIGAMASVLKGNLSAIILGGSLLNSFLKKRLFEAVHWIAPVFFVDEDVSLLGLATIALEFHLQQEHYASFENVL